MGKLCRQPALLAGLALLCLFLPPALGSAAQGLLSEGVDFSGIRLAVTAPEGDAVPELLEQYLGQMQDISRYCTVTAMEEDEALAALEGGEVAAVLALPENFVQGVMWGDNPDVQVIVGGERPLEGLLTLWVGQSACDLLSAVQAGIYAVLEIYDAVPLAGVSREQVVFDINLKYIAWTMNRQDLFRISPVSAAGVLPVKEHYALCLLAYFTLAAAPFFLGIYREDWLLRQRRLRAVGRTAVGGYAASVLASAAVLLLLLLPGLILTAGRVTLPLLAVALGGALFGAIFASFCNLAAGSAAGSGVLSFAVSLLSLILAGGLLPPVLLPAALQKPGAFSPVTWLVRLAGESMGYETQGTLLLPLLTAAVLAVLSCRLYVLRLDGRGVRE